MARIQVVNKQTGQTGTVSEQFYDPAKYQRLDGAGAGPAPSGDGTPQQPLEGQLLPSLGAILGGVASLPIPFLSPVAAAAGYMGGRALQGGINQMRGVHETPQDVGNALSGALGSAGTAASIEYPLRALPLLLHPLSPIGKLLQNRIAQAGPVPNQALESKFGTTEFPNLDLVKGLSSSARQQNLIDELTHEIVTQGRAGEGIPGPSYSDIFDLRKGSYRQGYDKTVGAPLQGLYKNIGRGYSDIIHEGVPGSQLLDTIYGTGSKIGGAVSSGLKYSLPGILLAKLLRLI